MTWCQTACGLEQPGFAHQPEVSRQVQHHHQGGLAAAFSQIWIAAWHVGPKIEKFSIGTYCFQHLCFLSIRFYQVNLRVTSLPFNLEYQSLITF